MRILIYSLNFSPDLTGIGKYTGEMATWLCAQGHDIRVVTAPPYYPHWRVGEGYTGRRYQHEIYSLPNVTNLRPKQLKGCIHIWRCPLWVPGYPSGFRRLVHLASFALSSFPLMLRQVFWRPDVVWVVEPALMCLPAALLTARLSGAKAWLHVQDFEVDAAFALGLVRLAWLKKLVLLLERFLMNRFDRVSTISSNMLALLLDKGVSLRRSVLFPNWVDTAEITPYINSLPRNKGAHAQGYRSAWGVANDTAIALYAGNMGEKQGLELVVEAAEKLAQREDVCFLMCGDGAAYGRLRQMATGLTNIRWIPLQPYERLNELLNTADIHLLPQHPSAADLVMPSKLASIFASGRPVVATAEPGTAVYKVVAGRGLLVQPGDVEQFVKAILELVENPTKRRALGQAAHTYAVKNLDKEVILTRFAKMLIE